MPNDVLPVLANQEASPAFKHLRRLGDYLIKIREIIGASVSFDEIPQAVKDRLEREISASHRWERRYIEAEARIAGLEKQIAEWERIVGKVERRGV